MRTLARRVRTGRSQAQQALRRSLVQHLARHENAWKLVLPLAGPLIVVADAIWHRIRGERVTIYILLLRSLDSTEAAIFPPVFRGGHEDRASWEAAFRTLPAAYRLRIRGLVCDGHVGLVALGHRRRWAVQRCHFHLLANLQLYLGPRKRPVAQETLALVRTVITTTDAAVTRLALRRLDAIRVAARSRGMRRVLSGLATNHRDFQSYLWHPELRLPTTTNAAESCINGIRDLMRRCRGFRTRESLHAWVTGYALWKKTIQCNGKYQQK